MSKSVYWQEGYDAAINLQPNNNKYLESSRLGQEWQEGYDQAMEDMDYQDQLNMDNF